MDPWMRNLLVLDQNAVHSSDAFRSLDLVLFGGCECNKCVFHLSIQSAKLFSQLHSRRRRLRFEVCYRQLEGSAGLRDEILSLGRC